MVRTRPGLVGKCGERLPSRRRVSPGATTGPPRTLACVAGVLCGGIGAALAAGEQPALAAAGRLLLSLARTGTCRGRLAARLRLRLACASAHRQAACPSARNVGDLCMGFGFAALVHRGRALRLVVRPSLVIISGHGCSLARRRPGHGSPGQGSRHRDGSRASRSLHRTMQ